MISTRQMKAGRQLLGWNQNDLAAKSGLSHQTIQRMEQKGVSISTVGNVEKVIKAFETAGVELIAKGDASEAGGGEGVRLKK